MKLLPVIFLFIFLCQRNCESGIVDKFAEYNEINAPADDSVLDDKGAENKVLEDALQALISVHNPNWRPLNKSNECQKSRKSGDDLKRTRRWTQSQITSSSCKLILHHEVCEPAGKEISPGKLSMCERCRRVYQVSNNCYPRYLIAEVCHGSNGGCAFDNGRAHGTCITTHSRVLLVRNEGNDNLLSEDLEMPNGCQCALEKHSPLSATPDA